MNNETNESVTSLDRFQLPFAVQIRFGDDKLSSSAVSSRFWLEVKFGLELGV